MGIPKRVKNLKKKASPVLIPKFGPLTGIRVLSSGSLVAMPHASAMMSDMGAEVIHIENPGTGDTLRMLGPFIEGTDTKVATFWTNDARNRLSMELDMRINKDPLSREVFLNLIKSCDIWMENLVWLEQRYGITDELILETNPQIVIVHVSGYGKPEFGGDPQTCWRASYDLIGQAYGGWSHLTGEPDEPPTRISPYTVDYTSALTTCAAALMGYIDAQETGLGQVIDSSQFETTARILGDNFSRYFNLGEAPYRTGNKSPLYQPNNIFTAADGYIAVSVSEPDEFYRFLQALEEVSGINPDDHPWSEVNGSPEALNSVKGRELDRITTDWIIHHARKEAHTLFEKHNVPSSPVYTAQDIANDPHWLQRGNFVECIDQTIQKMVTVLGVVPKFSQTPSNVWRGAPALGQDTEDVLTKILDYTPEEVQNLRKSKIV